LSKTLHTLTDAQLMKLDAFYDLLIEWNKKFNLTTICERAEVDEKHFLDSLIGVDFFAQNSTVCDVGAGAGFPSIPLAIVRKDLNFTLIDSLNKRVGFLQCVIDTLQLSNVTAIHARAEDFATSNREKFDVVCARAVAPLNILLEYTAPLCKVGGKIVLYKTDKEELTLATVAISKLRVTLQSINAFSLPTAGERRIMVFEKVATSPKQYPRGGNKPRLFPL
ncbi:MAG: 16S rRNA (guanine(527)-N(7))-methyltransferase RsmG, partial [Clostridia bacterium]